MPEPITCDIKFHKPIKGKGRNLKVKEEMKAGLGLGEEFCKDFDGIYSDNNNKAKDEETQQPEMTFLFTAPPKSSDDDNEHNGNDIVQMFRSELLDSLDHALQMLRQYIHDPHARQEAYAQLLTLLEVTSSNVRQILKSMTGQSAPSNTKQGLPLLSWYNKSDEPEDEGKMVENDIEQSLIIEDLAKMKLEKEHKERFVLNSKSSMLLLGTVPADTAAKEGSSLFIRSTMEEKDDIEESKKSGLFIKSGDCLEDWIVANNE